MYIKVEFSSDGGNVDCAECYASLDEMASGVHNVGENGVCVVAGAYEITQEEYDAWVEMHKSTEES